jgi:hypothetical protein
MRGKEVWNATRPVNGTERVYSLIRFSPEPDQTNLYLRVEEPNDNLILANLSLGEVVAYVDPEVFFDPQGSLHIMQPIAMSTYLYSRADAAGKIVHQGIFKTFQEVPPRLAKLDDGNVIVQGGLEENPNTPRDTLSQGQRKLGTLQSAQANTPVNMGAPAQVDPPVGNPSAASDATMAPAPDPTAVPAAAPVATPGSP